MFQHMPANNGFVVELFWVPSLDVINCVFIFCQVATICFHGILAHQVLFNPISCMGANISKAQKV